jgi:photosystem II stability/assembly factor-like uncharacterized protein
MKRPVVLLLLLVCGVNFAFSQTRRRPKHAGPAKPKESVRSNKTQVASKSVAGLGFRFVTPDHAGGVWITGTAWSLRGLMVNDRGVRIDALTVPGVSSVSHPLFTTRNIGWMIDTRSLYRTLDAGFSWQEVEIASRPDIRSVFFIDIQHGWAGGWDGEIYRTRDAGKTWKRQRTGVGHAIQQIFFVDAVHGWATGFNLSPNLRRMNALLRTSDAGNTWEVLSNSDSEAPGSIRSVFFVNAREGWAIDAGNNIVHTVDSGNTWTVQQSNEGHSWDSLFFINEREGWAAGDGILHTSDGGKTWNYQLNRKRGENYLDAITFIDSKRGWAVGMDTALRTTDGGATWHRMADDWKELIPGFQILLNENSLKAASKRP